MPLDGGQQLFRARFRQQHDACADADRKQQQRAEAERERERRRSAEDVIGRGPEHVLRKAVAGRHHVAMKMDGCLRFPGRSRRERDQAGIVRARFGGRECRRMAVEPARVRMRVVRVVASDVAAPLQARHRRVEFGGQPGFADDVRDPGPPDDGRQFSRAQLRHRCDGDAAGLDHAEPRGGQHRVIRAVQQHPIAGHEAAVMDEQVGDPVGGIAQFAIRPRDARPGRDRHPIAPAALVDGGIQQRGGAIEKRRKLQPRQFEDERRPILGRGKFARQKSSIVSARKSVSSKFVIAVRCRAGRAP